ncbi:MAG TPA: potassium channel family protein [Sphingomicrobium sp.]|nr:potassium channel family protein [Sphingomicrobium sp.]
MGSGRGLTTGRLLDTPTDFWLSCLLAIQAFTLFVAIPVGANDRILLDASHLAFVAICVGMLTSSRLLQAALLATMAILIIGPPLAAGIGADEPSRASMRHQTILVFALIFNVLITGVVGRRVFARGRVTVHRVTGAILLYLNVAAIFSVAYRALSVMDPNAFEWAAGRQPTGLADVTAAYSYLSLATITTTGYGDVVPVHWLARSLANLEAVFGQLFPATLLTRLIALELSQESAGSDNGP